MLNVGTTIWYRRTVVIWSQGLLRFCSKNRRHCSSTTGSRSPCQLALSGNFGAVTSRLCTPLCVCALVLVGAWLCPFKTDLSAIRSLPGRFSVLWSSDGQELYAEIQNSFTIKADIWWNNSQKTDKSSSFTDTGVPLPAIRFHGCFERKRRRRTGIKEPLCAQPAGREFLCKVGARNLRTGAAVTREPDVYIFYLGFFSPGASISIPYMKGECTVSIQRSCRPCFGC